MENYLKLKNGNHACHYLGFPIDQVFLGSSARVYLVPGLCLNSGKLPGDCSFSYTIPFLPSILSILPFFALDISVPGFGVLSLTLSQHTLSL